MLAWLAVVWREGRNGDRLCLALHMGLTMTAVKFSPLLSRYASMFFLMSLCKDGFEEG
jgi:hypothetical protein